MKRLILLLNAFVLLAACGHAKARVAIPKVSNSELEGIASYYAEPYNGRRTASGEVFDTYNAMTAAHKTLPFNTVVRVKNLNNGEEVDVRINDRGPFVKGRVIDLSLAAAKEIDLARVGIAPVKLKVLKDGSPTTKLPIPAAPLPSPAKAVPIPVEPVAAVSSTDPVYAVQVGAFQSEAAADKLRDDLAMRYNDVIVQPLAADRALFRVRVGRAPDMDSAEKLAKKLRDEHLNTFVVRLN